MPIHEILGTLEVCEVMYGFLTAKETLRDGWGEQKG